MKPYFTIWTWGIALVQGTLVGEAGDGGGRTADAIFHNQVKRIGRGRNAAFWTGTRGRVGARLVAAFHLPGAWRTARGRGVHYGKRLRQGSALVTHDIRR